MKIEKLIYTNERGESIEFSHTSTFHTNEVSGLSDIRNAIYSFNSMGQDGDTYLGNRIASREIEIVGNINCTNKEDAIELRRKLTRILNPQLDATLSYEYGEFKRLIDCKVDNAPVFGKNSIFQGFTIQLVCLHPFWREQEECRADIASWIGAFEFALEMPSDTGIEMGYRKPLQIVNVFNAGEVKTGLTLELKANGTVTDPQILNVDTKEFIKFNNLTLLAGDILYISTHYGKKTAKLLRGGIEQDAFRYLDIDSSYLQLAIGDNLLKYDASDQKENLEVIIHHNNYYLGV